MSRQKEGWVSKESELSIMQSNQDIPQLNLDLAFQEGPPAEESYFEVCKVQYYMAEKKYYVRLHILFICLNVHCEIANLLFCSERIFYITSCFWTGTRVK